MLVNMKTTARIASAGTPCSSSDTAWEAKQQWPADDPIVDSPLQSVFKALDPDKVVENVSQDDAVLALQALAEYVLEKFSAWSVPDDDDSESEDEEEQQPERSGNEEDEESDSDDDLEQDS